MANFIFQKHLQKETCVPSPPPRAVKLLCKCHHPRNPILSPHYTTLLMYVSLSTFPLYGIMDKRDLYIKQSMHFFVWDYGQT